ncbi:MULTISPECIES: helix-turn-helix domain-containing protein [Microbacterium]|uniref:helix-turn-helix domain-containing protein n=1 Tax=Microbacterium TaxID=33882 RepID=UPI001F0F6C8F|nr:MULTISPECIES: cupin domain-containing protein [Microbacterium]
MAESRRRRPGGPASPDEAARALGARIRALRQERGMTLAQAAAQAELSHSFLSQVERGLERLSMASLFRIARTLGTTQQALLTDDAPPRRRGGHHVVRAGAGSPLDSGGGPVKVLGPAGAPPFLPMIFSGSFDDGIWWEHDEEEFVYVLEGALTVVLEEEEIPLAAGDSIHYQGGVRHLWRTSPGTTCRALVVKEFRHPE